MKKFKIIVKKIQKKLVLLIYWKHIAFVFVIIFFLFCITNFANFENDEWLGDEQIVSELKELISISDNLDNNKKIKITLSLPSISQFLIDSDESYKEENWKELELLFNNYEVIFFPLCNYHRTHWSLVTYSKNENKFFFYDSISNSNYKRSLSLVKILKSKIRINKLNFSETEMIICSQQKNLNDCGVYVIAFVNILLKNINKKIDQWWLVGTNDDRVIDSIVQEKRNKISN